MLFVLCAVAALFIAIRELESARAAYNEVQRAREVLEQMQLLLATLQDAETGERGYVVTGKQGFLSPYTAAEGSLESRLAGLDKLLVDPQARNDLTELATLARRQVAFLGQVIELRTAKGVDAAAEVISQETGRRQMDSIRTLVQQMRAREHAQLSERLRGARERSLRAERIVRAALLSAIVLMAVTAAMLLRHMRQRERAENAASSAMNLLRTTLDNLSQGVAVFDAGQQLIAWNNRYLELRGLAAQDVYLHRHVSELTRAGKPLELTDADGSRTVGRGSAPERDVSGPFDSEAQRDDGLQLQVRGRPMGTQSYIMTFTDVTALKASESAYRDQAARLSATLDSVVDAIITINESASIESFSKGAERLFGYQAQEVLRRNVRMLMPDPHSSAHDGYVRRYIQTGEQRIIGSRREVEALHKDGRRIPVDLGISEMQLGNRRLFIGVVRDISARREVEQMKSGFVSTVSHELRTPLTSISGSLGLLAGGVAGELPSKAVRLINIAKLNAERLVLLINDILDVERAETGRLDLKLEVHRIRPIVQQVIDLNRAYAQGFGAMLALTPQSEDPSVYVDRDRLIQVLTNLLSNAVKFSPRGATVLLSIRVEADSVRVSVRDEGPGISEEFRQRIFQKFAQADSSDSRSKAGTGLGLSIAKTIIERLGGNIGYDSVAGEGATFYITLPLWRQPIAMPVGSADAHSEASVLVCEDDPDIASILAEILRKEGMRAETVNTARAARAALEAVRYDIAIVDLHLPDTDGLEFIAELRAHPALRSMPVIVVTARPRGRDAVAAVSALQLADWLQKPIDPQRLLEVIRNCLAQPRGRRARILHVEDDISLTQLTRELLDEEADVIAANSLAEGRLRIQSADYDLVILDIALGDGSGLDLLPLLNRDDHKTPVILYSANEATREVTGLVQAALVKSRDSLQQLLANVRTLTQRD